MSLPSVITKAVPRPRIPSDLVTITMADLDAHQEEQPVRSPSRHRSPSPGPDRRERSRTRSRSRSHRHHKKSKRHRRSRSKSSSRASSHGSAQIQQYIDNSLSQALQPLHQQLARLSAPTITTGSHAEYQELRKQQQELAIETKASSLTSDGAKSQYRCLASINLNLNQAVEAIDELLLSRPSPEDPIYQALNPIRNQVSAAVDIGSERIDLICKADAEPKIGWKAISLYEEKKRQPSSDPEKNKIWASCLKAVQEQKKTVRPPQQPFRPAPGWNPGRSSYAGQKSQSTCSRCGRSGHWAKDCYASSHVNDSRSFNANRLSKPLYHRSNGGYNGNLASPKEPAGRDANRDS